MYIFCLLVVFDTTNILTFELAKQFIRKIKEFDKNRTIILVGTQTDLVNMCVVDSEMFKNYTEKANVVGFEISVKKGENIDTLSEHLAKKLNPPTPQNNKTNEWHATAKYIRERADFQKIWDDSSLKNPKDKIFALLNDYTKNDSLLLRVLTFHWFRNEVTNVSTICSQSKDKNADELLQTLKKLKLTNPEGTLATIIELIEENMNKEPSTQERQSLAL